MEPNSTSSTPVPATGDPALVVLPLDAPVGDLASAGAPDAPRGHRGGRLALVAGIVALVGVVAAALGTMLGGSGGAGDPEGAVRQFLDAAAQEDILAAMRLLPPSEVGSAPELYGLVVRVLQKNDQLGPKGAPLAGVDVRIDDLELSTTTLADRVGRVEITGGTLEVRVDASGVDPRIRAAIESSGGEVEDDSFTITADEVGDRLADLTAPIADQLGGRPLQALSLVAIEQDGRWYVSPEYTMLEMARQIVGAPKPDFPTRTVGGGVASPGELVDEMVADLDGLDADRLADAIEQSAGGTKTPSVPGLVNPRETQAFVDYLPVFESFAAQMGGAAGSSTRARSAEATKELADAVRGMDIQVRASVGTRTIARGDGLALVAIDRAELDVSVRGRIEDELVDAHVVLTVRDGRCATWEGRVRAGANAGGDESGEGCVDPFPGTDFPGFFVAAIRIDGRWYLSPVETAVQYVRYALEAELAR